MKSTSMLLSRSILGACGLATGAYCAFAAFQNGCSMAHGATSCVFGAAFAAIVISSWFLLHVADGWRKAGEWFTAFSVTVLWVLLMAFVLVNAVIFTATTRTENVGERALTIQTYTRASEARSAVLSDLATVKQNPRWAATKGCTSVTTEKSRQFCDGISGQLAALKTADETLSKGRPAEADAGAATLAWVIDGDAAKVARGLPVFMAVVLELGASLLMKLALKSPDRGEPTKLEQTKPIPALTLSGPLPVAYASQPLKVIEAEFTAPRKAKAIAAPKRSQFNSMAAFFPNLNGRNRRAKRFAQAND